jgi:hypothetical protein
MELKLTNGKVAIVDEEDYNNLIKYKWYATLGKSGYYAKSNRVGYMHRFIVKTPPNMITDHINHNTLDNRKSNLRICTYGQNKMNSSAKKNGKSKYLGVSVIKNIRKHKQNTKIYIYYLAEISKDCKVIYSKLFKIELDAAKQYDNWAKEVHGEFANLNFK